MDLTVLARQSDGVVLCEWSDRSRPREFQKYKKEIKLLVKTLERSPNGSKHTADSGDKCYHYQVKDGVVFIALCSKAFPKKLAFTFLDEIATSFQEKLILEWGSQTADHRSLLETIEKPYYFIKFDRMIQTKNAEIQDPTSSKALQKLNDNLVEVAGIMRSSLTDIITRGDHLGEVGRKAQDLKVQSKKFGDTAKMLSFQALVQKYAPIAVFLSIILVVLIWRFVL